MLIAAPELSYTSKERGQELVALSEEISKILSGFIRSLKVDYKSSSKTIN